MYRRLDEKVAIWSENGVPAQLFHSGKQWQVIDRPTPQHGRVVEIPPQIMHPPEGVIGWRLIAKDDEGESFMFDLERRGLEWYVAHQYD